MIKRMLAWALALTLVLSCMPQLSSGVIAEEAATPTIPSKHSAEQHNCEHCDEDITWELWGSTTSLPTDGGHYYLSDNVELTKRYDIKGTEEVVLCLNGYTVDCNGKSLAYYLQDTAKLTIADCTAYTDAEGVFHAGTITGGYANGSFCSAIFVKNGAQIAMYNCIVSGNNHVANNNTAENYGGAVQIRGDKAAQSPSGYFENVHFLNNIHERDGGVLNVYGATASVVAKNCTFKNNTAVRGGAVFVYKGSAQLDNCQILNNTASGGNGGAVTNNIGTLTLNSCTISDNTAAVNGGALDAMENSKIVAQNCTIQDNTAAAGSAGYTDKGTLELKNCQILNNTSTGNSGGAVRNNAGTVLLDGCTISGNDAKGTGGSAVHAGGKNSTTTIKDCTVKDNIHTNTTSTTYRGAVYVTNTSDKLVMQGAVVVKDNYIQSTSTPVEMVVFLQNSPTAVDVGAVGEGSSFSIYTRAGERTEADMVTAKTVLNTWDENWVTYANNGKKIDYSAEEGFHFYVVPVPPVPDHIHCQCGETEGCTQAGHQSVKYTPWYSTTSLPTEGAYYLTEDVQLNEEISLTGNLDLCLCDKTVTAAANKRIFSSVKNDEVTLVISDCSASGAGDTYDAGKLTGGKDTSTNTGGGAVYMRAKGTFKLFDGIITENTSAVQGGGVMLLSGAKAYMYGGEISNNTAVSGTTWKSGGGITVPTGAEFYMYGGTISGNKGSSGGGICGNGGKVIVTGGTIYDNEATTNGGGIYIKGGTASIANATITYNSSAKDGGGVYVRDTELLITNCQVANNKTETAGGGLCYGTNSTGTVKNTTVADNEGGSGAGMIVQNGANLTVDSSHIDNNKASKQAGGVYLNKAELNIKSSTVTNNTAINYAGFLLSSTASLSLEDTEVTNNTASETCGGIYMNADTKLALTGKVEVLGNTAADKVSNLVMAGDTVLEVKDLDDESKIAVSAEKLFRAISMPCDDYSAQFMSDKATMQVIYKDGALYIGASGDHRHCLCAGLSTKGCDHAGIIFAEWDDPKSLPASGNWCLTTNVSLTNRVEVYDDLNLCLNGYTITANGVENAGTDLHFKVMNQGTLSITDCNEKPGKLTGGTYGAVLFNWDTSGGTFNLYNGILTGNEGNNSGGAVMVQCKLDEGNTFNMYGGKITGNTETAFVKNDEIVGGKGGGVYVLRGTFNMYGGEISENHAIGYTENGKVTGGRGGAIYAESAATVNLYGGKIKDNISDYDGGAIYAISANTVVTLAGTQITNNEAVNAGGGILLATRSHLVFNSGNITGNTGGKTGGGGIFISTNSSVEMNGGTVSNNTTVGNGGGIYAYRATADLNAGTITGNTAAHAAGVFCNGSTLNLDGVDITKNTASANGGGLKTARVKLSNGTYQVSNVTFTAGKISENTATLGGGFLAEGLGSSVIMTGGAVTNNKGTNQCGGMYISTGITFKMEGGTISSNKAPKNAGLCLYRAKATLTGGEITGNTSSTGDAGGLYVSGEDSAVVLDGVNITKNQAKNGAGAIFVTKAVVEFKSGKISGNNATSSGAGIYVSTNSGLKMTGGSISGNTAKSGGGGIYCYRSTATLSGGTISGNSAKDGGGIGISGATVNLYGTSISNNTASNGGGGVKTGAASPTINGVKQTFSPKLNVSGSYISNNNAVNGGGIMFAGTKGVMRMTSGSVSNNTAKTNGGGAYISTNTTVNITGGSFKNNQATSAGAVYHLKSSGTYENTVFSGNKVKTSGGAIYLSGANITDVEFKKVKIFDNSCEDGCGGAVYMNNDTMMKMTDTILENNMAGMFGGGIYSAPGARPILEGCTITGNSTPGSGGGICGRDCLEIRNSIVTGNKALCGAGIHVGDREPTISCNGWGSKRVDEVGVVIAGCTIADNEATLNGAGLNHSFSTNVEVEGTTFTGNKTGNQGAAIWSTENITMDGITVTDNVASNNGYAVYIASSQYDGHSYANNLVQMAGDMIVKSNEGGDLYLGELTTIVITAKGIGKRTEINIDLDSGVLTNRVFGAYNYEGENQVYTITYGDRSLTEPEYDPNLVQSADESDQDQAQKNTKQDILLYVGIGLFVLVIIGVVVLLIAKKKKTTPEATKN